MNQNREPIAIDTESHINPPATSVSVTERTNVGRVSLKTWNA
jgi:hypothetical protein